MLVIALSALALLAVFARATQAPIGDVKIPPADPNADHPLNHLESDPNDYGEPGTTPVGQDASEDDDEFAGDSPDFTAEDDAGDQDDTASDNATQTAPADPIPPAAPAGAASDGLVEVVDQFGQVHRVPPATARLIEWQANENQRLASARTPAPAIDQPPASRAARAPADDETTEDSEWHRFLSRFDALEKDVKGVTGTLSAATESRMRDALTQDAMSYFDAEIAGKTPVLVQRPDLAKVIKSRIERNLRAGLSGPIGNLNAKTVRDAVYVDVMTELSDLAPLIRGSAVANAQTRANAAKNAMPASGGSQGATTSKPRSKPPSDTSSGGFLNHAQKVWNDLTNRRRQRRA